MTQPMTAIAQRIIHTSGIDDSRGETSPRAFAQRLARYIRSPSTIRTRVIDQFGSAPKIDEIKTMVERVANDRELFKRASEALGQDQEEDAFAVMPSLELTRAMKKAEKRPPIPRKSRAKPKPDEIEAAPEPEPVVPALMRKDVVKSISEQFGSTYAEVVGFSRVQRIVIARRAAIAALRQRGNSFTQIGGVIGGRDHSTIMHNLEMYERLATPEMRAIVASYAKPSAA